MTAFPSMCRYVTISYMNVCIHITSKSNLHITHLFLLWQPSSDLTGLILVMSAVFGDNSPCFARGSQPAAAVPPTYTSLYPAGPPHVATSGTVLTPFFTNQQHLNTI